MSENGPIEIGENGTKANNPYDDVWRVYRAGQGQYKLTETEIQELAELAGDTDE